MVRLVGPRVKISKSSTVVRWWAKTSATGRQAANKSKRGAQPSSAASLPLENRREKKRFFAHSGTGAPPVQGQHSRGPLSPKHQTHTRTSTRTIDPQQQH